MTLTSNPVNPDDLVQISVVLPARLAAGVQESILRLLANNTASKGGSWAPSPDMYSAVQYAWDMPDWEDTPEDRLRMTWLVSDLDPKHVDVLARIHNEPATPTNELLTAAGYPEGTRASGVFRAMANRFRKVNRRPVWRNGEQTPEGQAVLSPGPLGEVAGVRLFAEAVRARAGVADATTGDGDTAHVDWNAVIAEADLGERNIALINAFRRFPNNSATAGMLADQLDFEGLGGANWAMFALGKKLATARSAADPAYAPRRRADDSVMWWYVVASGEIRDDGLFWWTLRSGLDAALRSTGI